MRKIALFLCVAALSSMGLLHATIFGKIQGIVHDPQHRPVSKASVKLDALTSEFSQTTQSNDDGEFSFPTVPVGDYKITVTASGFETEQENVTVLSNSAPILHFQLTISKVSTSATVTAQPETVNMESVTPTTLVDRQDIADTPGADRTNGLEMITDYVPAAYVTHDMLHMRGGHQVEWLIDGVTIPNTNIATNLGPQIDPKDIDYLEVQRGSYDAQYGDRTYGIFNIVPRSGFESDNQAEVVLSAGNWYQTNDQLNFASHTQRFAYYVSLNGNRSDYGLQAPIGQVVHDAENGYGGFGSLIFNEGPSNQFRLVASLRQDYYQIPIDPDPNSYTNSVYPTYGLSDSEREPDGYLAFSWIHTFNPNVVMTVSPFYHFNEASYSASPNDVPVITDVNQTANYAGAQASVNATVWKNNSVEAGVYGFGQHQSEFFNNTFTGCAPDCPNYGPSSDAVTGGLIEEYFSDRYRPTSWLTLIAGLRESHFDSGSSVIEDATSPRVGVALRIPKINWVFDGFYGDFYQPPPLLTATGPLLDLATSQTLTFAPLHGERDHEYQFGVSIPFHGWVLAEDTFQTNASNWLDHNNIGESNIFWPITWNRALIQGWETTLRSPRVWNRAQVHLAYSNQIAQAEGPITGGVVCPVPPTAACPVLVPETFEPVDHDQRNTLNVGANSMLPWKVLAAANVYYGSGFTNGTPGTPPEYPGNYLPPHTTVDISIGKSFGEAYRISLTALNVANRRVLLDNSLTFGGFHYNDPRQIYVEFRWRFHY
ncbi:MAG TPA: carboxypeptidase regulatory-like domain-containing protein [Bryobacteraceae bacterium]|nr:carboxypeptidase regulatory-like domain-containing protein [Bryobacteraceae bacterium]